MVIEGGYQVPESGSDGDGAEPVLLVVVLRKHSGFDKERIVNHVVVYHSEAEVHSVGGSSLDQYVHTTVLVDVHGHKHVGVRAS